MKLIRVILVFKSIKQECSIESINGIHDLELYSILKEMFPAYIDIDYDDQTDTQGYSYTYKNGLESIAICRY